MNECTQCSDGTTQSATYKCDTNDYRIVDSNNNLLLKIKDHGLQSDDPEIGDSVACTYCSCGHYWS